MNWQFIQTLSPDWTDENERCNSSDLVEGSAMYNKCDKYWKCK